LFLAREDHFVVTPTFHVFEIYAPHAGADAVRTEFSAPTVSYDRVNGKGALRGLNGSASVRGPPLRLTVVNPHLKERRETEIAVRGRRVASARATVLAANDAHAHNTFEPPSTVAPADGTNPALRDGTVVQRFPPASLTRLTIVLGTA
jgi:alpha-N-arabinofuranosidase